jgi:Pyruvate/2-oxoacid:ferredoxin oxidoreductase delta subunit
MSENAKARRVIEVREGIIGPAAPRPRTVRPRTMSDYPNLPAAYREVAQKLSSPLVMGPPICDELVAFVAHLLTEDEAAVVRYLSPVRGKTAAQVARESRRPVDQVGPILERLALTKRVIGSDGSGERRRYRLMPIMPGIFEMVLVSETPETLSEWHRKFIELFESLYETGYTAAFNQYPTRTIRYLPVGRSVDAHPMALPSDHMEAVLDRFTVFGIGQCQCRTTMAALGHGCGKPLANCTAMGDWAVLGIRHGWLKKVQRRDVLEIKREAESHGLVNFVINVESARSQVSCSCCGCCCKAMRTMTEFNAPSLVAPPHFLPAFDPERCTYCGKCATACPMGALTLDLPRKSRRHASERCIGCGVCAVVCPQAGAITMQPVPKYDPPYSGWFSLLAHNAPAMARNAWRAWRNRP